MTPAEAETIASGVFEALGGTDIDPPTLMPASRPLDVSGEAVRARLCVFTDASGQETALRPDLTLPVADMEAERLMDGASGEQVYRYAARAFRLPSSPGMPMEFVQVGFERFGASSGPQADVTALEAVLDAVNAVGAPVERIVLGDLAVFDAFVDTLDLPPGTRGALSRAFRLQGGVGALLAEPATTANTPSLVGAGTDQNQAEAMVERILSLSGTPLVGGRSVADIATRLREKAAEGSSEGLTDEARAILRDVIAVKGTPEDCISALNGIAASNGLAGPNDALTALRDRMAGIMKSASESVVTFDSTFGRQFNYYDGFVFEIFAPGAPNTMPIAAGGRYDSLIHRLSAGTVSATGIGGVVRPERLAAALEAAQ